MAETTGIAWTDSTFNPWIGCTKVSPGCDNCYAETLDKRHRWGGDTHWGAGKPRMRTSAANWRKPLAWNRKAAESGKPWRVFCASLADVFDNEVPRDWRVDLWNLIEATPHLTWLLLTKRIGNFLRIWSGWTPPPNVWIGATIVNQEEADRDIPKLLATPAAKRFVSYEPALGPITWRDPPNDIGEPRFSYLERVDGEGPRIDWIIVGGESGPWARPFNIQWARDTVNQCRLAGVAPFVKQLGSFVIDRNDGGFEGDGDDRWPAGTANKLDEHPFGYVDEAQGSPVRIRLKDRAGADPAEWPEDLRVQEFPA